MKKDKRERIGNDLSEYQKWVDYDMKKYGRISDITKSKIRKAGLSIVKDQYGDYEVIADRPIKEGASHRGFKYYEYPKGSKCHVRETPSAFVAINEYGLNIGQSPTFSGAEGIIDDYLVKKGKIKEGCGKLNEKSDYNALRKAREFIKGATSRAGFYDKIREILKDAFIEDWDIKNLQRLADAKYHELGEFNESYYDEVADDDIDKVYRRLSKLNKVDFGALEDEYLETRPSVKDAVYIFYGTILNTNRYCKDFVKWAKEEKGIELKGLPCNEGIRESAAGVSLRDAVKSAVSRLNKSSSLDEIKAVITNELDKVSGGWNKNDYNRVFQDVILAISGHKGPFIEPLNRRDESLKEAKERRCNYGHKGPFWYFTTHGVQPGSIPNDVHVLEIRDGQNDRGTWGSFVALDGVLTADELRRYDMKEMRPRINEGSKRGIRKENYAKRRPKRKAGIDKL